VKRLTLEEAAVFHGHLGPFLTLGYIAGLEALSIIKANSPFKIEAIVRCPSRRPYTCFIDGVQCATSCTMGKGNIKMVEDRGLSLELRDAEGKSVVIKVRDHVIEKIMSMDMSEGVKWVSSRKFNELFIVEQHA